MSVGTKTPLAKITAISFLSVFSFGLLAYAALDLTDVPTNVTPGTPLTSSAWNDMAYRVNKAVKQDTPVLTVAGGNLNVAGQVKITGGAPGAGKTLTSDASGLASWGYAKTPFVSTAAVATSIPSNSLTILRMTDQYDPSGFFDPATYRFQPTVAGYYEVSGTVGYNGAANAGGAHTLYFYLYKNGSSIASNSRLQDGYYAGAYTTSMYMNEFVYLNGTTDYLDMRFLANAYTGTAYCTAHMVLVSP
jgi:hypothetical protein